MEIFKKKPKDSLPKSFEEALKSIRNLEDKVELLSSEIDILKRKGSFHIQKVGIIRFNPFKEIGGDQSFSAALLDENDSGVVITSLYGRDDNRVYGKAIEKGKSEYALSEEENKAIEKAKFKNE